MGTSHGSVNTHSICEYSTDVPEYWATSLWGPQALQARGGYQKIVGKNILKLEKIGWVGVYSPLGGFFTIPSWDFSSVPP